MPVDKKTVPNYINIVMNDDPKFIKEMREQAEEDDQNCDLEKGEKKKLSFTSDNKMVNTEEYYFDSGNIYYSAYMGDDKIWYSFEIPLSDIVLIDILEYSCKKLNKLKTALETLK